MTTSDLLQRARETEDLLRAIARHCMLTADDVMPRVLGVGLHEAMRLLDGQSRVVAVLEEMAKEETNAVAQSVAP